ncbi:MAG TPA: N-acetylmuramoyl-L-alanine amidase [Chthoniobacterales bacterium]|nr:N-acetylmuramoyl-L-alanine amidase [Chthoniobacterales bacterium]
MVRFRVWLTTFLALSAVIGGFVLQAQQTDEEKPTRILKARAVSSPSVGESPTPKPKTSPHKKRKTTSPSPRPKAKAKKTPAEESEASPTPSETPEATPKAKAKNKKTAGKETSPRPKKKKTVGEKSPSPHKAASPKPSETSPVKSSGSPPRAIAVPSPSALPPPSGPRSTSAFGAPVEEPEQLTIEKYGYEKPRGFWARLFGGGRRSSSSGAGYRYLTRAVRDQIDRAPVARSRWQFIVVHNSGTRQGNAAAFDYYHRHIRRMQNGLAYHFVIGNGTSTGNGQIEVGDRWRRQINGGHVHSDYLNNIALGICLVGDFNRDQPTRAQLDCCEELIRYLRQRCGKVGDHYPIVKPHREMNPPRWATDCPGDVFPYSWFRRFQE